MSNQQNKAIVKQAEVNYKNQYLDPKNPHPGETLLKTLDYCFQADIEVPEWARDAYRKCYKKYQQQPGKEPLVMAFKTDTKAGKHREKQLRKQKHLNTVCHTLWHLHINENMPIDDGLFEEIAKRHGDIKGVSASTVKAWYGSNMKPMLDFFGGGFCIYPGFVKPDFQKD